MASSQFKLGMAPMLVEPGGVGRNLRRVTAMIQRAAQADCDLVALPECSAVGWLVMKRTTMLTVSETLEALATINWR